MLTTGEIIALITFSISLMGTVLASVWKLSSLSTSMTTNINDLRKDIDAQQKRNNDIEKIPQIEQRLEFIEQNTRPVLMRVPKIESKIDVIEEKLKHSREMRKVLLEQRQSRPDTEEAEGSDDDN